MPALKRGMRRLGPALAALRSARMGNITVTFALLLVPMLGTIAIAIDFAMIASARTIAQSGADAAALQAIAAAQNSPGALSAAEALGKAAFDAYAQKNNLEGYTVDVKVSETGGKYTAVAQYSIETFSILGDMLDRKSIKGSGQAQVESSPENYANIHVLADASQSLGLGATERDMAKLQTYTGCAFVCHRNDELMKLYKIKTRIDVIRDSIKRMIGQAKAVSAGESAFQFSLYTMTAGLYPDYGVAKLNEISTLSSDYDRLMKLTDSVKMQDVYLTTGNTFIEESLTMLRAKVRTGGDGSSKEQPKEYIFFMTDGLRDTPTNNFGGVCIPGYIHCLGLINQATCKSIKDKNITLAILYARYLPILANVYYPERGTNLFYNVLVQNPGLEDAVLAKSLKDCASPGWFFPAANGNDIATKMNEMFTQLGSRTKITQ